MAVSRRFYDAIYRHPELSPFFENVDQRRQEAKLVRFIQLAWNDSLMHRMHGRYLHEEHEHMHLTDALFDLRHELFDVALREQGLSPSEVEDLLRFNESWRRDVVEAGREA